MPQRVTLKNLMKIAVIGAGPAGITAAYMLSKNDVKVEVFEAGTKVGGLAKTIELWNQRVDLGPHRFFSSDERVNGLWLEVVGRDYFMVNRLTRIYYKNKFFYYPLKPFDALFKLGFLEAFLCVISYLKGKVITTTLDGTFETWVVNHFGRRLFEIFFKTYSEKLWGISCKELDADFAAQRIRKLSLYEAIKNALLNGKGNKHKTLLDQFAYPKKGAGIVYERMAKLIEEYGGIIHYKSPVKRVLTKDNKVIGIELKDGTIQPYDYIISTMPLSLLVSQLPEVPSNIKQLAKSLKFRNTILVYLNIQATNLFPDNWLYIHSPALKVGRITNFRNWSPGLYGNEQSTVLAMEYWCNDQDPLWHASEEEIIELGKREIRKTKIIKNANILDGFVHKIHRCYPVYNMGYRKILEPIEAYLDTIQGLKTIGRYGAFKYNNQDHSILMGILAAENIINDTNRHLWVINTDYQTYQEASEIMLPVIKLNRNGALKK